MIRVEAGIDHIDRLLLNRLQTDFPLSSRPYAEIGAALGISEGEVLRRVRQLKKQGVLRQISAIFDSRALGYKSTLVAMKISPERLDEAAEIINRHPGVSHNYAREHTYNLWFTLTIPPMGSIEEDVQTLARQARAESTLVLRAIRLFKIGVSFDMTGAGAAGPSFAETPTRGDTPTEPLSDQEISIVRALQEDLSLESQPFARTAQRAGVSEEELLARGRSFLESGVMRRFAATLRHRRAGFAANAMGVWVVPEEKVEETGRIMAGFEAVSHCYQRPTYPDWPYSLFTMIHGRSAADCEATAKAISEATGITEYGLLYSTKEYKKIRVKYFATANME